MRPATFVNIPMRLGVDSKWRFWDEDWLRCGFWWSFPPPCVFNICLALGVVCLRECLFYILFLWLASLVALESLKSQSSQWNCFPSCLLSTCLFRISPASYSHWPHFDLCDLCWCFIKFPRISVLKSHFAQIWFYNLWCFIEFSLLVTYAQKLHFTFCSSIRLLLVWVFKVLLDDVENSQRLHFR